MMYDQYQYIAPYKQVNKSSTISNIKNIEYNTEKVNRFNVSGRFDSIACKYCFYRRKEHCEFINTCQKGHVTCVNKFSPETN